MQQTQISVPPHVQLIQMGTAHWVSSLLYTAAKIRLADHLGNGPRTAADLAEPTGTDPKTLNRFMRTLASFGILAHGSNDTFRLTPLSEALKSDAPGAAWATILTMAGPWSWKAMG